MNALSATAAAEPGLWQATLDALPACVAVLDVAGDIVVINRSWSTFAGAHGDGPADLQTGLQQLGGGA